MTQASRWSCAGRSDRGGKRKINEDSILIRTDAGIWLAADGMGGHEAGDVASRTVADSVAGVTVEGKLSQVVERVEEAIVRANLHLREHAARAFGGRTMGSTVVSFIANERIGVCLWAGDSRLYRLRNNKIEQISRDHSEVQELLDRGLISEEEAAHHPNSNVITRAVGGVPDLFLDAMIVEIRRGDVYLLCSDGLYNELSSDEIRAQVDGDLDASADRLLQATLAKGARDNVSIVLVRAEVDAGVALGPGEGTVMRRLARDAMIGESTREEYAVLRRRILDRYAGTEPVVDGVLPGLKPVDTQPQAPLGGAAAGPAPTARQKKPVAASAPEITESRPAPESAHTGHAARDLWVGVVAIVLVLGVLAGLLAWLI